ncbi:hypothetical protein O7599_15960 [Streptomyces sp. WMMC500]|uniref:hypothetical protein n=1 Tax=Streptomyces sp. WMMC500 TaxID=3015154 RepID=UPI00248BD918|nr:hypothetical protein [Streptomyces sp. WMMC500]WBB63918.1 hypothetical protein O7599_15960 [Streptomyces sp. WMMC500]
MRALRRFLAGRYGGTQDHRFGSGRDGRLIEGALMALAAAGGAAVAQAAGTDAWISFRTRVAGWFGRGDAEREQAAMRRLDATAAELAAAAERGDGQPLLVHEAMWRGRFQDLLESLQENERDEAGRVLRALLDEHAPPDGGASAGDGGLAAGRDTHITAEGGSIATGVLHGNASISHPSMPTPPQG